MNAKLANVRELAEALGVPIGTIYYWVSRYEIPYLKLGKHLRFDIAEVLTHWREKTRAEARTRGAASRAWWKFSGGIPG